MKEEEVQNNNKVVIIVIISLFVGFAIGWFAAPGNSDVTPMDEDKKTDDTSVVLEGDSSKVVEGNTTAPKKEEVVDASKFSVLVADQQAGQRVVISQATIGSDAWIAVYEDMNGVPGNILGARFVSEGTYTDLSVEMQRSTEVGTVYYVMIHGDDGVITETGSHVFDLSLDTVRRVGESTIVGTFTAKDAVLLGN